MGKHAQLVMGPAGSGKSTYCDIVRQHCENIGRTVHVVNLDPAAEVFKYPVSVDIRELITVDEIMEDMQYGPNGGLVFCMEYLIQNLDWLRDEVGDFEEDYLIIDCPGQIELFTHYPVMRVFASELQRMGYQVCAVYTLDSNFMSDSAKFISGMLMCLSVMYQMELPHINVLTKMDVYENTHGKQKHTDLEKFFDPDLPQLTEELNRDMGKKFYKLNAAIGSLLENDPMVSFIPLNIKDEDSIEVLLAHIDNAIQYGEDLEPKAPKDLEE
ncbi:ATP binding protein [Acanthamoeba castellanii str. Neff]|uniref:GPN-loop GTPase 3 n=1 Tax=Acanthamoeba castellanii (strain ATCC 30010 / Neff) TaxID=1257118 RepID=L8GJ62_ACACF|nr:ATP binding protein [Acanthamoeba castellanii str. Neff]ELR12798.1 ATP binding protein [Acanthamoeba castellanii str. Neff]